MADKPKAGDLVRSTARCAAAMESIHSTTAIAMAGVTTKIESRERPSRRRSRSRNLK